MVLVDEAALQHPGVALDPGSAPTLAQVLPLPVEEVAGVVAVVARTASDLHRRGVVHGDLAIDTVVVDRGRPLVTAFDASGPAGTIGSSGLLLEPAADVAALGKLILHCLALCRGDEDDPWATLRSRLAAAPVHGLGARVSRLLGRTAPTSAAGELEAIATLAMDADPSRRPTAVELADDIQRRIPEARLPGAVQHRADDEPPAGARQKLLAGTAVALAVVSGAALWSAKRQEGTPPPLAHDSVAAPTPAADPGPVRVWPPQCAPSPAPRGDLDGDGCPEQLDYRDGVLTVAGARYAIGSPGDVVTAGAWRCDGRSLVALLRPSEGKVVVFDGWAELGRDLFGTTVALVPGAVALDVAPAADGCPALVARRGDGSEQTVALRS